MHQKQIGIESENAFVTWVVGILKKQKCDWNSNEEFLSSQVGISATQRDA